jgi:cytoskeleton protein RodZ
MSFGDRLREAREQRKVSLHAIAEKTNISVRFLDALEKGHIEKLPGGIFIRGFVRSYASHVGLDPDETVKEFLAAHPGARADEDRDDDRVRDGFGPVVIWLAVAAVIAAILAGLYLWSTTRAGSAPPAGSGSAGPAPAAQVLTPASQPASVPGAQPARQEAAEQGEAVLMTVGLPSTTTGATPDAAAVVPVTPSGAPMLLTISPAGRCWIQVTADGRVRLSREVAAGEQVEIEATQRLDLVVGDAGAFAYRLNGRPGRPLGRTGQVVRVTVSPSTIADFQLAAS